MPPVPLVWPAAAPGHGEVTLRATTAADAGMVRELSQDPYIPMIGTIPAHATQAQALDWIAAQQQKWVRGSGYPFTIVQAVTSGAVGHCGLWLSGLAQGRASAGYAIAPRHRGRGFAADALTALTAFAWTVPGLRRVEAYVEPSNAASIRAAERAGYERESVLPRHLEIGGRLRDMALYAATSPSSA